jgi:flagellar M-ring protein FliF
LTAPKAGEEAMGAEQLERQQRLERDLSSRVVALIEPVVGEGRVRVNVALKLNPGSTEQTQEHWDPETVIRSRQTSTDATTMTAVAGVAGTRSNLPGETPAPTPTPQAPGTSRQTDTTNYEVSRTTTRTIQPPGDVARMSVAVILDDDHETKTGKDGKQVVTRVARKPEELQKLQQLVSAAVGIDEMRGDRITVQNVGFDEPPPIEPEAPSFLVRYERPLQEGGRILVVLVIAVAGLLFLKSMFGKAVTARDSAMAMVPRAGASRGGTPRTVAELENEIEAQLDAAHPGSDNRRLPVLTKRAAGLAQKDPANTAKLLRSWMVEEA